MNAPERLALLPDIQARPDPRNLPIDAVGVKGVRYPVRVASPGGTAQPTVGEFSMMVALAAPTKGTHMSRFLALLEAAPAVLDPHAFEMLVRDMLRRLDAPSGDVELRFAYFLTKTAPVSGVRSRLDYQVTWRGQLAAGGGYRFSMRVVVPATSLCPCSKEISAYGAHNQRSHLTLDVALHGQMAIEELVAIAEQSASCEVYGLLKRVDEKHVTERAYENPKFAEDIVRDLARALDGDARVGAYTVEVENFESIHNHSAYARIDRLADPHAPRRPASRDEGPGRTL